VNSQKNEGLAFTGSLINHCVKVIPSAAYIEVFEVVCRRLTYLRQLYNVSSLRPLLSVYDIERNFLSLVERLEALALNCAEMDKYVLALVCGDKAVAFALVKPLYGTLCHEKKAS